MDPKRHKTRLLKVLEQLKTEVCKLLEDEHLKFPYKSLEEVERDIDNLTYEIERTELLK